MKEELENLREQINSIDSELVKFLEQRAKLAREIGRLKHKSGLDFFDPSRQKNILDKVLGLGSGAFPPEGLRRVFLEIMSTCLALEQPLRVGYLGPEGTFTHQAAVSEFGSAVNFIPLASVDELFTAVEKRRVDYSVVAIENSTGGVVHTVLDRFLDSDVKITSEIILYIHHCLISDVPPEKIQRIFSHPQPFMQCRLWLKEHLPQAQHVEVASTVEGVRRAKESSDGAAIGSELAARLYEMNILESDIQDTSENYTRFVILGQTLPAPSGADKTSLILSIKHKPGSLFDALKPFAQAGINLTKIESRPTRQHPWEYVFFIDFEGHANDEKVKGVLEKLKPHTIFIKFLGSYPRDRSIK